MAAESRRTDPPLTDTLFTEGFRFEFFQAVRILERLYPHKQPVGHDATPGSEAVRFRSRLSLNFPPSAVYEVAQAEESDAPAEMTTAFMGLTGPLGVLPRHYTELLLDRARQRDRTLLDFLDLFNHRLLSLFYRAWEKYRFPIAYERRVASGAIDDNFSLALFDLIGMGTTGLRGRLAFGDEALLFYAGLLSQRPHSASALAAILQDYFHVPAEIVQFVGQWLSLPATNRSRLSAGNTNNALGVSTVAGDRVWDQQAKFRIRLGPMTFKEFTRFLPTATDFPLIIQFTRFFVGQEFDFEVQLVLKASEVPQCRLGDTSDSAPRLGWTTWARTGVFTQDVDDVVFSGHLTRADAFPGA